MAVLLVTVYFEKKLYRSPLGKLLTAVAFILGAAFLAWLFIRKPPLYTTLLYMVQKVTPGNPSFDDRFESIYINLHLLSFRPRVGREVAYVLEIIPDNTSSTTILFAILGIFSGWLHVIAWLCLVLRGKGHWATKLLCLLALGHYLQHPESDLRSLFLDLPHSGADRMRGASARPAAQKERIHPGAGLSLRVGRYYAHHLCRDNLL